MAFIVTLFTRGLPYHLSIKTSLSTRRHCSSLGSKNFRLRATTAGLLNIDNRVHAFLDGVTAAVVGLMAWTTVNLLRAAIDDWSSPCIGAGAFLVIFSWHSKWAVIAAMAATIGAFLPYY
jgi:hypothetical protein